MIDRGGLTKCKNDFYVFMREVEMACKQIIPMAMANRGNAKQISETITSKEAVCEQWVHVVEKASEQINQLKTCLIEEYVKVRCFAFVQKKTEHHKQEKCEPSQKSRSFRTKLSNKQNEK